MALDRSPPPREADEKATLTAFLEFHRATFARKCAGLSGDQLRERAVPPSPLSLLGLVRHLAEVERNWFPPVLAGAPMSLLYSAEGDWDAAFRDLAAADVPAAFEAWEAECERARGLVAAAASLEVTGVRRGERYSLRWVLAHMIEEYARHNGHADLLRERLDGSVGT